MLKRSIAFFLILFLLSAFVPAAFAEESNDSESTLTMTPEDYERFGNVESVEHDETGLPIAVNGCPVRQVRAGINLRAQKDAYLFSVWFTEYPFWQPATQYDGNLAVMSLAMALSANRALSPSQESSAVFNPALHLVEFLTGAGFSNIRMDDYSKETSMYTISMAMGSRVMEREGEEPFTLIAIGVCGGGYKNEWQSNMTPGSGELHEGFLSASQLVIDRLAGYILSNGIKGDIKIWISGFSRAAAVSNVTAGLLVRKGMFDKENVYAYTFATPAAVCEPPESGYENIFNILNPMDVVPQVMPYDWNFGRFGQDRFIPVTEFSSVGEIFTDSRAKVARDTFGIEANYSPALNLRMRLLLSMIMDVAENRAQYNAELQPAVVGIMQNKNASNLLSTVRSLLLTVRDKGAAGRLNIDTLVNYLLRVFGSAALRTELSGANQNTGSLFRRLFNEHCEDSYLASIDLIRSGIFEDDYEFTYVLVRGPVSVLLYDENIPSEAIRLTEKGQLVPTRECLRQFGREPHYLYVLMNLHYMERIGDTSIIAIPHDANYTVTWEAVGDGTVEVMQADCSVHASARYYGATSAPVSVHKGDTGTAFSSAILSERVSGKADTTTFEAADLARFIGIDSVGINWRVALMLITALIGTVVTLIVWGVLRLQRTSRKPGVAVWLCLGIFFIAALESELSFWFFADHTNLRMLWKMILGVSLLIVFLIRHRKSPRTLLMLPGFFLLLAGDVVICLYFLQGAILFLLAHAALVFAFLFRSPMPKKMWIQWVIVSLISSALLVFGFRSKIGWLAGGAAVYAAVLLLMNYSAGGQAVRVRFAAKLFLISDALLAVFTLLINAPVIHILYMAMFYIALLMLAVSKTGVELPKAEKPAKDASEPESPSESEPSEDGQSGAPDPEPQPA